MLRAECGPGGGGVELGAGARDRIGPAREQLVDDRRASDPRRAVEQRALGAAADDAAELRADEVEDETEPAAKRFEDEDLLLVDVELVRERRGGPLAASDRGDRGVRRADVSETATASRSSTSRIRTWSATRGSSPPW